MLQGSHSDELATASKLEDGVKFYQTSSPEVAKHFHIDPEAGDPALLNKAAKNFTLFGTYCLHLNSLPVLDMYLLMGCCMQTGVSMHMTLPIL